MMIFLFSCLSGILYRMGGYGKPFKRWHRFIGVPFLCGIFMLQVSLPWYLHIIAFGLFSAAISTYHDYTGKDRFWLHGFVCGLAYIPFQFIVPLHIIIVRSILCMVTMQAIHIIVQKFDVPFKVWIEEISRGVLLMASLLLLTRRV